MTLTEKETTLLQDLKSDEQLCIEKYKKYADEAKDGALKNLFTQIGQKEQEHLNTVNELLSGAVPQMASSGSQSQNSAEPNCACDCDAAKKERDKFLCSDALSTEKHVSSVYNTSIFEFKDQNVRNILNHIQKEEQEHGEKIYNYMAQNNMYN